MCLFPLHSFNSLYCPFRFPAALSFVRLCETHANVSSKTVFSPVFQTIHHSNGMQRYIQLGHESPAAVAMLALCNDGKWITRRPWLLVINIESARVTSIWQQLHHRDWAQDLQDTWEAHRSLKLKGTSGRSKEIGGKGSFCFWINS